MLNSMKWVDLKIWIMESSNMVGFSFPTSEDLRNATTYVKEHEKDLENLKLFQAKKELMWLWKIKKWFMIIACLISIGISFGLAYLMDNNFKKLSLYIYWLCLYLVWVLIFFLIRRFIFLKWKKKYVDWIEKFVILKMNNVFYYALFYGRYRAFMSNKQKSQMQTWNYNWTVHIYHFDFNFKPKDLFPDVKTYQPIFYLLDYMIYSIKVENKYNFDDERIWIPFMKNIFESRKIYLSKKSNINIEQIYVE